MVSLSQNPAAYIFSWKSMNLPKFGRFYGKKNRRLSFGSETSQNPIIPQTRCRTTIEVFYIKHVGLLEHEKLAQHHTHLIIEHGGIIQIICIDFTIIYVQTAKIPRGNICSNILYCTWSYFQWIPGEVVVPPSHTPCPCWSILNISQYWPLIV